MLQEGGSSARAAEAKRAVDCAATSSEEPLHRSKTCWLHLKYAVDDLGTLQLCTTAPGKCCAAAHFEVSVLALLSQKTRHSADLLIQFVITLINADIL